jgi:hypothetical protein
MSGEPTDRVPLRLRMSAGPGLDTLDGGWWPQSHDLTVELADLADHFPQELGQVLHAVYSPPDWDSTASRRVSVRHGFVALDAVPQDDTHLVLLRTSQMTTLQVLVIPVDFSNEQGEEALLAASTSGYAHSASCLLDTVLDQPDSAPWRYWT